MRNKLIIFILIFTVLMTTFAYAERPNLTLKIDTQDAIFMDEEIQVDISVADFVYGEENPVSAIDFSILYDSEHLEYMGLTSREGLYSTVSETVYGDVYKDNRVLISMVGSSNAITSDSDLVTLNFRPQNVADGTSLMLHSAKAATAQGVIFTPEVTSIRIRMAHIYDVNKDGVINLVDLAIVSYNVGNDADEYYYADVNRDGLINTDDIEILMNYIREQE